MKGMLLPLGIGVALYFLYSKKQFVSQTNWSFEKLNFDLKKKRIKVTLGVANPTNESAEIQSITGNLIINGSTVATVESFENQKIAPANKSFIQLNLIPSAMGIFSQAKTILEKLLQKNQNKTKVSMKAVFAGAANVNGIVIPINLNLQ
jgi:ERCC4-related helicase